MNDRRVRDKEKTVQEILAAARQLFSEKGLHGTSIRDIENASGVSKGLILHHFGTKEKLYAAVQDLLSREYVEMQSGQRQKNTDFKEIVITAIESAFKYSKENRDYRRIGLWSYLEGQERYTELEERFSTTLIETMQAGQHAGLVRDDIDPFLMPFIIKGTIEYWIQKENLIQALTASRENPERWAGDCLVETLAKLFFK